MHLGPSLSLSQYYADDIFRPSLVASVQSIQMRVQYSLWLIPNTGQTVCLGARQARLLMGEKSHMV